MQYKTVFILIALFFIGEILYSQTIRNNNISSRLTFDETTEVVNPADGQIPSTNILSNQTVCASPVDVFKFDVNDYGADGNPTSITNIRIKPATTNTANWTENIQDVKIDNGSIVTTGTAVITNDYIDISINTGDLVIAEAHSGTITISICLNESGLSFGSILSFKVDAANHGFTADASGSQFASTFTANVESNDFQIIEYCAEPNENSSSIVFENINTYTVDLNWIPGDGENGIIIAKEGSPVDEIPIDNTTYFGNTKFGSGDEIGTANFVVYNGHSNNVHITGLSENLDYYFKIFEFNCSVGDENYLTSGTIAEGSITTTSAEDIYSEFLIYPNPSSGIFIFETNTGIPITSIKVTNINGQEVINTTINLTKTEIDLSNFPKGIYFLEVKTDDDFFRSKIINK